MALGLIVLALAYFGGVFLRNNGLPGLQPAVFTAAVMGVLMFTVVNTEFWQMKSVRADAEGITIERYTSSNSSVRWTEVKAVNVQDGSLFPVVSDDTSLVLVAESGEEFPIPRFLADADGIARAVQFQLGR